MSFPSVARYIARGLSDTEALLAAVKEDCSEAVAYLHCKAHEAQNAGKPVLWSENPNSKLGKQLIRIHASDAVRPLVQERICHGMELAFVNCCSGQVGGDKKDPAALLRWQIECQAGPVAYADC
ncbi:MAG TPA: hypothetical protein VMR46_03710 [Candidatus Paceibacterota bacterium]|nr:hypothetical protein [Candidatus Paceibacterota bacterium]